MEMDIIKEKDSEIAVTGVEIKNKKDESVEKRK